MYPKHYYQSPTYRCWAGMLTRVRNPNREDWRLYGGRGISVDERWLLFENFLADMGEKPKGKTLDRIDNDGHYTKGNCKWSSHSEQMRNRRSFSKGEKNHQARLTWKIVKQIREEWTHTYESIRQLAIKFNVSFGCVHKVVYNQSWQGG